MKKSALKSTPGRVPEMRESNPSKSQSSAQLEETSSLRKLKSGKKSVAIEESKNQEYNDEIRRDLSRDIEEVNSSQRAFSNAAATLGSNRPEIIRPANIKQGEILPPTAVGKIDIKQKSNKDDSEEDIVETINKTPHKSAKKPTPAKKRSTTKKSAAKSKKTPAKSTPKSGKRSTKKFQIEDESEENIDVVMNPSEENAQNELKEEVKEVKLRRGRRRRAAIPKKGRLDKSKTPVGTRRSQSKKRPKGKEAKGRKVLKRTAVQKDLNKEVEMLGMTKKHLVALPVVTSSPPNTKNQSKISEPKTKKRDLKKKEKVASKKKEHKPKKSVTRGRSTTAKKSHSTSKPKTVKRVARILRQNVRNLDAPIRKSKNKESSKKKEKAIKKKAQPSKKKEEVKKET